jgi:hypothetical protein
MPTGKILSLFFPFFISIVIIDSKKQVTTNEKSMKVKGEAGLGFEAGGSQVNFLTELLLCLLAGARFKQFHY